jgi:hypothetical protein
MAKPIEKMDREELNRHAETLGITPEDYSRKDDLLSAVQEEEARRAEGGATTINVAIDTAPAGEPGPTSELGATDPDTTPIGPAGDEGDDAEAQAIVEDGLIEVEGAVAENRTALFERDARHPGGEVFIRSGQRMRVFETQGVFQAIKRHRLKRV